jgi:hypothetical protein
MFVVERPAFSRRVPVKIDGLLPKGSAEVAAWPSMQPLRDRFDGSGGLPMTKTERRRRRARPVGLAARLVAPLVLLTAGAAAAAPSCPIELGSIEAAKPNKLYLYFPTADDAGFPASGCTIGTSTCFDDGGIPANDAYVSPLKSFDITRLTSYTGTVGDLRDRITDVVTDDYCEFDVKVIQTTTVPPTTFARRLTVGIGTDDDSPVGGLYGEAQEVDSGDSIGADYARVWAGTYQGVSGGPGGALNGANSTLQRWAFSIGGTAAHEAGHTYGATHADGATTLAGEDPFETHIMPAGPSITPEDRAGSRRHFDDTVFSKLAANVGLSIETIHNWDFTNPNSVDAHQIQFELLSTLPSLTLSWTYLGGGSPWSTPSTPALIGTTTFRGVVYNRFRVTWSTGKAWNSGSPGVVPAGVNFHVGAAFSSVDYSTPDPVIVVKVTLLDGGGSPLTLQPRMVGYDAGALDAADGALNMNFFNADDVTRPLLVRDVRLIELPRVASIDSMVAGARPVSWQGFPISPWKSQPTVGCGLGSRDSLKAFVPPEKCQLTLGRENGVLVVARLSQGRHIAERYDGKCPGHGRPTAPGDSIRSPDVNECPTRGFGLDLFPSTTLYVTATVVDPAAKHWDPKTKTMVVGPLASRLFYQVAGRHPDLNRNGVDDYIDIATGVSRDPNHTGVPGEVTRCLTLSRALDEDELATRNTRLLLAAAARERGHEKEYEVLRAVLERRILLQREALEQFRACEVKAGMGATGEVTRAAY